MTHAATDVHIQIHVLNGSLFEKENNWAFMFGLFLGKFSLSLKHFSFFVHK